MESLLSLMSPWAFVATFGVTLLASFVKGAVGFAMPAIMISGLASFLSAELALAALIVPTLVANMQQSLRDGLRAAWSTAIRFRLYLAVIVLFLLISAQLVRVLPENILFLLLGGPVVVFSMLQLAGWRPRLPSRGRRVAEAGIAAIAGFVGGISGIWGPPTIMYLSALGLPKAESVRAQGVIYGIGAVMLAVAHLQSGVLNARTVPLSVLLVPVAMLGMRLGFTLQDRLDQRRFRTLTLWVLLLAGLNLVRRGIALS